MYIWETSQHPVPYEESIKIMQDYVDKIHHEDAKEKIWLLEHPHLYSLGVSATESDIIKKNIPIFKSGRGGKITYHGANMRIAYIMINLKKRNCCDIRKYIYDLEQVIINSLLKFNVLGERRNGRIGIWVKTGKNTEDKIAAIGVRIRKWITFHGLSINIAPDLSYFNNIIPCGIDNPNYGVTSLKKLGINISMQEFDDIFKTEFIKIFPDV